VTQTAERTALDPVAFQVITSRLSGIVQEMQDSIFRTGYSTVIRESQDASCVLLDAAGNVIGEHVILPLHLSCLPIVVKAIKANFAGDIRPGDAFLTNHPYLGGTPHSMDMAVVSPVFFGDMLIAFCASIAHKTDLGGVVPGTANANAREIFQEGIQFPPTRIMRAGAIVGDIEAIVRANSRTPDVVMGDIRGQIGVARLAERRIEETVARYGLDASLATFAEMQNVAERRTRRLLSAWPDGVAEAERFLDGVDAASPVRFHVRAEKRGERIAFDFSGCDDQSIGPINIRPPLARGAVHFALIAMLDAELPNNGGIARCVDLTFRPGSILDPVFPAPTNTYMATAMAVTEVCIRALGQFVPERMVAGASGGGAISVGGTRPDGSRYLQYELSGSAFGARSISDGPSGIAVLLNNARCASIEIVESEFPARVMRWELVRDSGGAGRFRGGLGARRVWRITTDVAQLTVRGAGHWIAASGSGGGRDGAPAHTVIDPGTPGERELPGRVSGFPVSAGVVVMDERGGGGGLGDPRERALTAIAGDVIDGYVSRESAIRDYGVEPGALDAVLSAWDDGRLAG
jgi:N-methylhydantoinase B